MSVDDDDDATVNSTEGRLGRVFLPLGKLVCFFEKRVVTDYTKEKTNQP